MIHHPFKVDATGVATEVAPDPPHVAASEPGLNSPPAPLNPPRVVLYGTPSAYEVRMHNPKGIADAIGPNVLAAFYKCIMGAERILVFENLMYLNDRASTNSTESILDDHAYSRNHMVLAFLLAGTMHEVGAALQELCSTAIVARLQDRSSWAPLNKLRAEWNTAPYASTIRNGFAYHLGEQGMYLAGILKTENDPVVLFETSGGRRHAGRFRETWDSLFRGHNIQNEDMEPFVARTAQAHYELPDLLFSFFYDVLVTHGVSVTREFPPNGAPRSQSPSKQRRHSRNKRGRSKRR